MENPGYSLFLYCSLEQSWLCIQFCFNKWSPKKTFTLICWPNSNFGWILRPIFSVNSCQIQEIFHLKVVTNMFRHCTTWLKKKKKSEFGHGIQSPGGQPGYILITTHINCSNSCFLNDVQWNVNCKKAASKNSLEKHES